MELFVCTSTYFSFHVQKIRDFFAQPGDYEIFAACPPFFTYIPNPNHEREKNLCKHMSKKFDLLEHAPLSLSKFFFQIYNMNCTIYFAQKHFFNPTH